MFFGKGTDADPFEFLDAAPAIKKPLDLVDTDSDDESSLADSTTSATTAASSTVSVPVVAKPGNFNRNHQRLLTATEAIMA